MTALLISLANSSTSTHRESNKLLLYGVIIYFYLEWLICIDKLFFYLKNTNNVLSLHPVDLLLLGEYAG